ncbi:hypothetical protein GCM10027073_15790 [Streptomyces chlorus]
MQTDPAGSRDEVRTTPAHRGPLRQRKRHGPVAAHQPPAPGVVHLDVGREVVGLGEHGRHVGRAARQGYHAAAQGRHLRAERPQQRAERLVPGVGVRPVHHQQPVRAGSAAVHEGGGERPQAGVRRGRGPGGVDEHRWFDPVGGHPVQQAGQGPPVPLVHEVAAVGHRPVLHHRDDPPVRAGIPQRLGPCRAEHDEIAAVPPRHGGGRRGPDRLEGDELTGRPGVILLRGRLDGGVLPLWRRVVARGGLPVLGDEEGGDGVHRRVLEEQGGVEGRADQFLQLLRDP